MDLQSRTRLLSQARSLIGNKYDSLDCSHFVQKAFESAGMKYDYLNSSAFASDMNSHFKKIGVNLPTSSLDPGDVIVYNNHMGIWDPEGCTALGANQECKRLKSDAPFLSSRSSKNRGPDFGRLSMWTGDYQVYRWIK
jgi:NlpC/P60 family